jgi:hypothetical protein
MKFSVPSFALLLSTSITAINAELSCGNVLTTDCWGDTDIRYDKDSTNSLLEQNSHWHHEIGFWRVESCSFDKDGNPAYAIPYDEVTGTFGAGRLLNFMTYDSSLMSQLSGLAMFVIIMLYFLPCRLSFAKEDHRLAGLFNPSPGFAMVSPALVLVATFSAQAATRKMGRRVFSRGLDSLNLLKVRLSYLSMSLHRL